MPISTISQVISTIPEAGRRGVDVQTVFVNKQEDFQDHLQGTTVTELNALKTQINTTVSGMNDAVTTVNTKANEAEADALSASASATTATTKAGEASTSAGQALASENRAAQWADADYNVEVEVGKYSAKHWATVAQSADVGENTKGANIASASTTTIGTTGLGDYIHITGTTTITSFGTATSAGTRRTLIFDGALTVTHNATSLICPGATSITTVAGTVIEVIAETTANWRVVSITHPSLSMAALGYLDGVTSAIQTQINTKAPLSSPTFTGAPTAPTPATGDRSTKIATTQMFANEFANSLVGNGYQKLPSGLIIQWGSITTNGAGTIPLIFPIAFPTNCAGMSCISTVTSAQFHNTYGAIYTTGTTINSWNYNGTSAGGLTCRWIAIGY